jgi:hypothetical protein
MIVFLSFNYQICFYQAFLSIFAAMGYTLLNIHSSNNSVSLFPSGINNSISFGKCVVYPQQIVLVFDHSKFSINIFVDVNAESKRK